MITPNVTVFLLVLLMSNLKRWIYIERYYIVIYTRVMNHWLSTE